MCRHYKLAVGGGKMSETVLIRAALKMLRFPSISGVLRAMNFEFRKVETLQWIELALTSAVQPGKMVESAGESGFLHDAHTKFGCL